MIIKSDSLREKIFTNDPNQSLRIKRLLMAFGSYLICFVFVLACYGLDLTRLYLVIFVAVFCLLCVFNLIFYTLIRSGSNLDFTDPGMTLAQIFCSIIIISMGLYYAHLARAALMLFYFFPFVFGLFRLTTREFLWVSIFALLAYAIVIILSEFQFPHSANQRQEFVQWLALAIVTPWFSLIGGYITRLRKKLKDRQQELLSALNKINELATHDELTGVFNRRFMLDVLQREVALIARGTKPLSLCIMDLDFFKNVNDTLGHSAGDAVLVKFAQLVQQSGLRDGDYFGRYGGEEFILLLSSTPLSGALVRAERIRREVEALPLQYNEHAFSITVSIGVVEYSHHEDVKSIIDRADLALYRAKHKGRNRIES